MATDVIERNERTVRRLFEECLNERKLELLQEIVAPDYEGSLGEAGPAGLRAYAEAHLAGFPDIHYTIDEIIAVGERVVVRWTWTGHHTGRFRRFEPTNRRVTNTGIAVYHLRDGKIAAGWIATDRLGFLQELGIVPADIAGPPPSSR